MRLIQLFVLSSFLFLMACSTSKNERPVPQKTTPKPIVPVTNDWKPFWKEFSNAVEQNQKDAVVKMVKWPLVSSLVEGGYQQEKFIQDFDLLFDDEVKEHFRNLTEMEIQTIPSNEQMTAYLKIPAGIEVKSITVSYVFDKGTDSQTESSKTFIFGQNEGQYQLMAIMFAG